MPASLIDLGLCSLLPREMRQGTCACISTASQLCTSCNCARRPQCISMSSSMMRSRWTRWNFQRRVICRSPVLAQPRHLQISASLTSTSDSGSHPSKQLRDSGAAHALSSWLLLLPTQWGRVLLSGITMPASLRSNQA